MNLHNARLASPHYMLLTTVLIACGCGRGSEAPNSPAVVHPGVGLPECHIGMPISALKETWQKPKESNLDPDTLETYLDNCSEGLEVKHDGAKISAVFVHFQSDGFKPFAGRIEGGIGPRSSIEDIIRAKGQPTRIAVTHDEDATEEVELWYVKNGILYEFRNKTLADVAIVAPITNVPSPLKEDIGDTSEYRTIDSK